MLDRVAFVFGLVLILSLGGCKKEPSAPGEKESSRLGTNGTAANPEKTHSDSASLAEPEPSRGLPADRQGRQGGATSPDIAETEPQPHGPAGPRWRCDEATFDFGEVWAGKTVKHDFIFRNTGTEKLKVLEARPRCSCSVAENYSKEVEPGGTGVMPFVLRTANKPGGRLNEWLTIKTNDPVRPEMRITLTGVVRTVCRPEVVYDALYERDKAAGKTTRPLNKKMKASFGRIKADDRLHRVIKLYNTSGRPLSLELLPLPTNSNFKAELKETVPGEEFELTVTGEPPFPVGRPAASTPIRMKTNVPEKPIYQLHAYAYVPPRVEVVPEKIVIDRKRYTNKLRKIRINNYGETPVDIIAIETSDPQIKIKLLPPDVRRPQEQAVQVVFPETGYEPPPYGELIQIKTNDAQWPVIQVPVLPTLRRPQEPRPADKPLVLYPVDLQRDGQ